MIVMAVVAAVLLLGFAQEVVAEKPENVPVMLEKKLHGAWKGGACLGDWTFGADGTFVLQHYSPGNNKLTGHWKVRWDALPPPFVLTFKTSDAPNRVKVGETWEVKLIQLDDETFAYEWPLDPGQPVHITRVKK